MDFFILINLKISKFLGIDFIKLSIQVGINDIYVNVLFLTKKMY